MELFDLLKGFGIVGYMVFLILILLLPLIGMIYVSMFIANMIGATGYYWWAFVFIMTLFGMNLLYLITSLPNNR